MVLCACDLRLDRVSELLYDDSGNSSSCQGMLERPGASQSCSPLQKRGPFDSAPPRSGRTGERSLCGMTKVQFMDNEKSLSWGAPLRKWYHSVGNRGVERAHTYRSNTCCGSP